MLKSTKMPGLISTILHHGIPVSMEVENNELVFTLRGFYKSNGVRIYSLEDEIHYKVKDRYKEEIISDFSDLVGLHYYWWISSKNKYEGWATPDPVWIPALIKYKFITETTKTVYEPCSET